MKKVLLSSLMLAVSLLITACSSNATEGGDNTPISQNEGSEASPVTLTVNQAYNGKVGDVEATDETDTSYYMFNIAELGEYTISISDLSTGVNVDLYLYDDSGFETVLNSATDSNESSESLTYSFSSTGTYYLKVVNYGTADITFTLTVQNDNVTTDATLTLNQSSMTIDQGSTGSIITTATSDGSTVDTVTASSSDTSVATVSVSNNLITVSGIAAGTATVTVTSGSGKTALCSVTVTAISLTLSDGEYRIGASDHHALAIKSDGTVWAWGKNEKGQLGDGTTTDSFTPVQVSGLSDVVAVSAGGFGSYWGISAALKSDGTVWTWGGNSLGQLGNGTTTDSSVPVQVSGLTNVSAVIASQSYMVALKSDGTVWAWGYNGTQGYLGNGTRNASYVPVKVSGLSGITAISSRAGHTLALKNDGTVWSWGSGSEGQLANGTYDSLVPAQVIGLTDVAIIGTGSGFSFAVKHDGTVWGWGSNSSKQLGDGTYYDRDNTPVQVLQQVEDVVAIGGGRSYSFALKSDGTVWRWGSSQDVEIASGLTNITSMIIGYYQAIFMSEDGTVKAWGNNDDGVFGDGTTDSSFDLPVTSLIDLIP